MTYDVTALRHVTSLGRLPFNCQLGLGLVTLIMSFVVNPNTNPNESQRSKITDLLYLFNCQLGLVTLILSDDSGGSVYY